MSLAGQLNLGPLQVNLRGEGLGPVSYSAPGYQPFFNAGSRVPMRTPLVSIAVELVLRATMRPPVPPIWQRGQSWAAWEDGDELIFGAGFHVPGRARYGLRIARDLSRAELALDPEWITRRPGPMEAPLHYPLDQVLTWGLLSKIGGALIHAAAAVKGNRALVFAGRSGAGKSTLAGWLQDAGWELLSDDRVMVFRRNHVWQVSGTPWHGSGGWARAAEFPLAGILFLYKDRENRRAPLPPLQAKLELLDVASVPWFEDSWAQATLDGLNLLILEIPPQRFHFTKPPGPLSAGAELTVSIGEKAGGVFA